MIILTKTTTATNTKPTRILAVAMPGGKSATRPVDYRLDTADNHANAAQHLAEKLGLRGRFVGSVSPEGYVFVLDEHTGFTI